MPYLTHGPAGLTCNSKTLNIREFTDSVSGVVDAAMSSNKFGEGLTYSAVEPLSKVDSAHGDSPMSFPEVSDPDNDPCEECGWRFGDHSHDGHFCPNRSGAGPFYLQTRFTDGGTRAAFRSALNNWIVDRGSNR